jgi:membrane fusion protein (multidrug efflux system)
MSAFPYRKVSSGLLSSFRSIIPAIVLSALLLTTSCSKKDQPLAGQVTTSPMEVTAFKVTPRDLPLVLDYLGQTEGSRVIEVRARVEGVIQKMSYTEGRMVKAGDILYRIDPKPFEISLENIRAQLAQEEARLENSQRSVKRLKPLVEQNAVSQKDLDDALSAETTAIAAVRGAKARVNEAEVNLGYTVIHATISGIAGRAMKQEGSLVSPGQDGILTTVSQIEPMYVNFNVSETDIIRYNDEEQKKMIRFPQGGNFDVELQFSDGSILPNKGKLNFATPFYNKETGMMGGRAVIGNPVARMLPGQSVRVFLKGAVRPNAILVPQRAVMQGQKGKFVFVVDGASKAEMRNIEVGEWSGDNWTVLSGLKAGDTVVVDGGIKLQNGMPIKAVFEKSMGK